ncbi:unnamed protein product [Sphacelaria rigidula]
MSPRSSGASFVFACSNAFFAPIRSNLSLSQQRTSTRATTSPMRMQAAVVDRVMDVVGEQLDKKGEVNLDSTFVEDLGADSLDTIELIMALEEEFKIEIAEEDATKMQSVKDAVTFIEANI